MKKSDSPAKPSNPELGNEGEGSRSASRRNDAGAERALDGADAGGLKEAESRGKLGGHIRGSGRQRL
jgi:hypothetical protein